MSSTGAIDRAIYPQMSADGFGRGRGACIQGAEKFLTTEAQRTRRKKEAVSKSEAGIKKLFSSLLLAPCFLLHPFLPL
jgi:hypothetical protein